MEKRMVGIGYYNRYYNMKRIIESLKQIRFKEFIVAIPPELKVQFNQMQLKNNLFRLKLLGVITVIFNAMNWPFYILHADGISTLLNNKLFIKDLCQLFITLLFVLLSCIFSNKNKHSILWFICYLFIILHYFLLAYNILIEENFLFLQFFFSFTFLYTFVPDFKPKIFISLLILWYFSVVGLLIYKNQSFIFGKPQVIAINIFIIALLRIFYYNSKVETFIDTFKIQTLNEKLKALSMTDELTRLNNRRSFLDYFDIIWKQSRRLHLPVNILMLDVDYFKKYNDSMGHLQGDRALIAIAQCMKNQIKRDTDFVARFGGEEFLCILPYIEKKDAANFAKELVQSVENMKIYHPMSEISKYITISVGMASVVPDENNSQTQLLDEADKALYEAKHSGRNRAVIG
jgi:diguanylate cyclase (GGDEF)-like protein